MFPFLHSSGSYGHFATLLTNACLHDFAEKKVLIYGQGVSRQVHTNDVGTMPYLYDRLPNGHKHMF